MDIQRIIDNCSAKVSEARNSFINQWHNIQYLPKGQKEHRIIQIGAIACLCLSVMANLINGLSMLCFGVATVLVLIKLDGGFPRKYKEYLNTGIICTVAFGILCIAVNHMPLVYFGIGVGLYLYTRMVPPAQFGDGPTPLPSQDVPLTGREVQIQENPLNF